MCIPLTIFSKPECHLCDEMKQALAEVAENVPLQLTVVDISRDKQLLKKHGMDIPLLFHEGTELAKHRFKTEVMIKKLKKIIE